MNTRIKILKGAVPLPPAPTDDGAGADLIFEGIVRPTEDGRPLAGLSYEVYHPMAKSQLTKLSEYIVERYELLSLDVVHSEGFVAVGEASVRVEIRSEHRAEALLAMCEFMDILKKDVPIWKSPVFADEEVARQPT